MRSGASPWVNLIEYVAAGNDRRPKVREHFDAVRGLLEPEVTSDGCSPSGIQGAPSLGLVDQS